MAKGFERTGYGRRRDAGYPEHPDAPMLRKLGEIVSDLYMSTDERDRTRLWASASRLLAKSKADKERVAKIVLEKRVGALSQLVVELQALLHAPVKSAPGLASAPASPASAGDASTTPSATEPSSLGRSAEQAADSDAQASAPTESSAPTADQLKHALKAFRKRLKMTRLDDESKLGHRAMSGGRQSKIVAILPPREYPRAVWDELVRQGRLKNAGQGFYELVGG